MGISRCVAEGGARARAREVRERERPRARVDRVDAEEHKRASFAHCVERERIEVRDEEDGRWE